MAKIVVKFGGTSVGSIERIKSVAKILRENLMFYFLLVSK